MNTTVKLTLSALALSAAALLSPAANASPVGPLCPQGEDDNGRLTQHCQMWIAGTVGDDNGDGLVSEDESGWANWRPGVGLAAIAHGVAAADGGVPGPQIEEDDPRWDCRTMGNLVCGPGNAQGVPPGDYGEIDYEAHIDWLIDTGSDYPA